jgi:uncharacterized repeat protein (TIGR03806 family)
MILRFLFILCATAAVAACGPEGAVCNIDSFNREGAIFATKERTPPPLLSATACVNMSDPAQGVPGAIPYDINEPFWSDGAEKQRYMALPDNARIELAADGDFLCPVGTVLIKHFRLDGRFIETRFFVRKNNAWRGYNYRWDDTQTEAQLLNSPAEVDTGKQTWFFPGGQEHCQQCHTAAAGFSLGLEISQLNKDYRYPGTDKPVNQIDYLQSLGVLAAAPAGIRGLKLASSKDAAHDLNARARAYLHSNCSQCHRPEGGTQSTLDLRAGITLADMNLCNATPRLGNFGLADARLLTPGDHARSILWNRIAREDNSRMPPLFSKVVDSAGVELMRQWIDTLTQCGPLGEAPSAEHRVYPAKGP